MSRNFYFFILLSWFAFSCTNQTPDTLNSSLLKIEQLTNNTFVHTSYLKIPDYGNFPCNGLVFYNNGEAIVFDTPTNDSASVELINWVQTELNCSIKAVVVNHFHDDCLGGLKTFHEAKIESYANNLTLSLAKEDGMEIPKNGFNKTLEITIGKETVINTFIGEGHSKDNIVSYISGEKVLFGGCLIKELNAKKGYLGDANVNEWSNTVQKVKETYPDVKTIVPGHGKSGGKELLEYTIQLFEPQN